MDYAVKIKSYVSKEPLLIINDQLADKLNLIRKKRCFLSFGTQKNYIDIQISKDTDELELLISDHVIEDLHLPSYPIFEVRTKNNEIILGPCIGILASQKYEDITKRRLIEISMNTLAYSRIHGAIIVFSLDKVDKSKRLIDGYCFNPENNSWNPGVFPYPMTIFRRSGLNTKWKNHFLSIIGDTVFSNYSFNKWDMHRWFSSESDIAPYLPTTRIYNSKQDIINMLDKYGNIYVKPIWGMKGFGVVRISQDDKKMSINYRENDINNNIEVEDSNELDKVLEKLFEKGGYIIQQGLDLISFDGGIVDFRCVMQKNEASKWICNGIIARIGAKESVVSNISSGGAALPGIELIKEALSQSELETFTIKEKMMSVSTKVCKTLDEYGFNFGTLGLDIGIDKEKNIWLIEVNNRNPHPAIALRANDISVYYTLLTGPLYYAKSLAGFGIKEESSDVL